jgi:hypothetical protein
MSHFLQRKEDDITYWLDPDGSFFFVLILNFLLAAQVCLLFCAITFLQQPKDDESKD